jgi:anti-sigma B factor antagonist
MLIRAGHEKVTAAVTRHDAGPMPERGAMERLACAAYDLDDFTVVVFEGDIGSPADLRRLLHTVTGARSRIVVDLTEVTFIDTTALGALLGALRRTRSADGWVRLVCRNQAVLKVLRMTDLDSVFEIHDSIDEVRALSGGPWLPAPRDPAP